MKMRSNRMRLIWFGALILLLNALAGTAGAGEDETVPDTQPSGDLQPAEVQEGEKDVSDTNTPVLLTLQDAQAWALRDNPTLAAAEAQVKQAAERIRQAQAAFWPQVSLTAGATHTELSDASVDKARAQAAGSSGTAFSSGGVGAQSGFARAQAAARSVAALAAVPDSADSYTVALTANYLLFDGFARNYALSAARIGKKEADLGRLEAARLLLEAVSQAYYGVQLARERVRIAEADRAYNERLLTEARARYEAGAAALSEVLNFEVLVRAAEASVIEAKRVLAVARIGLAGVMGLDDSGLPDSYDVTPLDEEPREMLEDSLEPDELIRMAWTRRPDVSQRAYAVLRSSAQLKAAKASFFPSLTAFVQRQGTRAEDARFGEDDFATTYGINFSWNIFSGFQRSARVAEARAALAQSREQERAARIDAAGDVREAVEALLTARRQLLLQRDNAQFVARNRQLVEAEFLAGQTSLALLNQAQRNLVEAEGNLAGARVALRRAWHQLETATGQTLQRFYMSEGRGNAEDAAPINAADDREAEQ